MNENSPTYFVVDTIFYPDSIVYINSHSSIDAAIDSCEHRQEFSAAFGYDPNDIQIVERPAAMTDGSEDRMMPVENWINFLAQEAADQSGNEYLPF